MTKFRSAIENIWYHHKVRILFGLFVAASLVFCLHSCLDRTTYDLQVYYVTGGSYYKEQLDWLEQALIPLCPDTNGDGQVTVSVTHVPVGKNVDPSERAQNMTAVHAGEVFLFFGDEEGVNYLYENGFLQPVAAFVSDPVNDYAWEVSGSAFSGSTPGFELFSARPLYLSLRAFDGTWASSRSSVKTNYETALTVLSGITPESFRNPENAE